MAYSDKKREEVVERFKELSRSLLTGSNDRIHCRKVSTALYEEYPDIPKRTIREWTEDYKDGFYITKDILDTDSNTVSVNHQDWSENALRILKNTYIHHKDKPESNEVEVIQDRLSNKGFDISKKLIQDKVDELDLPSPNNSDIRTAIVLPDMQVPYHDKKALSIVEEYMADNEWDYYINIGDFMDLDQISHYNDRKPRILEGKRLKKDFKLGSDIITRHRNIVGDSCEMYYIEGNHEDRLNRYLDKNPEHEGLLEIPNRLPLSDLGVSWIKFWSAGEVVKIGKATFIHGRYTNKYHAKKHVNRYITNVFTGHTHDFQSHSIETKGNEKTYVGQSLGCLCEYDLKYKQGQPDNWQQGFAVFHFFPDGNFNYFPVRIFNYRFVAPNGVVYEA